MFWLLDRQVRGVELDFAAEVLPTLAPPLNSFVSPHDALHLINFKFFELDYCSLLGLIDNVKNYFFDNHLDILSTLLLRFRSVFTLG